jgi:hypothetical protein
MSEDRWLDLITLRQLLERLAPADRDLMILVCALDMETGYDGPWPPTHVDIGDWVGRRYEGAPIADSTVRWRRDAILALWRGERGALRRNRRKPAPEAGRPPSTPDNRRKSR